MAKVFVSYRRGGASQQTYRLTDELKRRVGEENLFLDVDSIAPGEPFAVAIDRAIRASDVVLVIIGPRWLKLAHQDGTRRIDDPDDHLRIEIETALNSGVKVIPVLVNGAVMPQRSELPESIDRLSGLHAQSLIDTHWAHDVDHLIAHIDPTPIKPKRDSRWSSPAIASLVIFIFTIINLAVLDETDELDHDAWVGAGTIAAVGLALAVYALRKLGEHDSKSKTMAIISATLNGFVVLAAIGEAFFPDA